MMLSTGYTELQFDIESGLQELIKLQGALVVGLGNWKTGQCISQQGIDSPLFPNSKIITALTGNAKVIQAKMQVAQDLQFSDKIDQILIALSSQWHLMKVLSAEGYFIYLALDRTSCNIASAGFKLIQLDKKLSPLLNSHLPLPII
jgi:hypothetical protein